MASKTIDHAVTATDTLGAASDPTYAGIPSFMRRKLSKAPAGADVTVWGIPFDSATSNRPGTRFGPGAIRRASQIFDNDPQYPFHRDLFETMRVVDYGDCLIDYRLPETAHETIRAEAAGLLAETGFLLTLGGDHSITWPLLQAHAQRYGPLSLVHFDAHQDTWPMATPERVDHGSFLTAAVEQGLIDPVTSIQIGIRTHAPTTYGLEILHGYDIEEMTSAAIAERIAARCGNAKVYLTFDIDCLDVAFCPGTGTPVSGGPTSAKMLAVLRRLGNLAMVGADIVEVSPPYDHADITAVAGSTVAQYVLGLLAEKMAAERRAD